MVAKRHINTNGIQLSVSEAGPEDGVPVLLLHGWPELARSWHHQMQALADAGFRAIAPDLRGFGGSSAPQDPKQYGIDSILADLTGLLDALEIDRAIWCGHDWGGLIVWHAAQLVPERVMGVIGVNTPHSQRAPMDPIELLQGRFGPDHYIVRFQQAGMEQAFEGREEDFFHFIFAPPPKKAISPLPSGLTDLIRRFGTFDRAQAPRPVVPESEITEFAKAYRQSGFTGGLNYYRNFSSNWRRMQGVDQTLAMPCLMIGAELDPFLPPQLIEGMDARIADLEIHVIAGSGHWTQWEKPAELSTLMVDWVRRRFA